MGGYRKLSWGRMYHSVELVWNIVSQCVSQLSIVNTASVSVSTFI